MSFEDFDRHLGPVSEALRRFASALHNPEKLIFTIAYDEEREPDGIIVNDFPPHIDVSGSMARDPLTPWVRVDDMLHIDAINGRADYRPVSYDRDQDLWCFELHGDVEWKPWP